MVSLKMTPVWSDMLTNIDVAGGDVSSNVIV